MSTLKRDAPEEVRQMVHHIIDDVWERSSPADRKKITEFVAEQTARLGRSVEAAHLRVLVGHW